MENLEFVLRVLTTMGQIPFVAMLTLWPINDKPTSKGQFIVFAIIEIIVIYLAWCNY